MTRFVLPDGTQAEAIPVSDVPTLDHRFVKHETLGVISVAVGCLTAVPPSLPEEPPNRSVVLDRGGDAWQRNGDGEWELPGVDGQHTWAYLNERYGPLRRLVPDPSDDAPELPWFQKSEAAADVEDQVDITPTSRKVWIAWDPAAFTPDEAELRAAVILRAAREARRIQHNQG